MKNKVKRICANCTKEIEGRGLKFCCQSCNAQYHNKTKKVEIKCLNCENITTNFKFCTSKCQQEYQTLIVFKAIENGDTTFEVRNYKRYLISKYGEKCMVCGWCELNPSTGKVPIELEHIDGNSENNSLTNLKLLCPNHHSLTPTYKNLNKGNGRHKRRKK